MELKSTFLEVDLISLVSSFQGKVGFYDMSSNMLNVCLGFILLFLYSCLQYNNKSCPNLWPARYLLSHHVKQPCFTIGQCVNSFEYLAL